MTGVDHLRADWTYRGTGWPVEIDKPARILVEHTGFGPTERQHIRVIRELQPPYHGGFGWGYSGGSPARAAEAILTDALGLDDLSELKSIRFTGADSLDIQLRNDFVYDVMSQVCGEWRLRRGAVLRWVLGWFTERGVTDLPAAVVHLPVADPFESRRRPPGGGGT